MFIVPISQMPSIDQIKATQATPEIESSSSGIPFADVFKDVLAEQQATQALATQDSIDLAIGNIDNLHEVSINGERATAALELTVQMATRALSAYNEILRIQI